MKKPLLTMLLAGLLSALTLVSCGQAPSAVEVTTAAPESGSEALPAKEASGVPDSLDLKGEKIRIWYTTKATSVAETFVDIAGELTGDILDDAIYNTNRKVEDRLGCALGFFNSDCPTSDTGTAVQKLILADDTTYDLFHVVQWNAAKLAADGLYLNIYDAPYLSLDKPWWDSGYMKEMTIGNKKLFALVGDYAVDRTRCLNCFYYNKAMYEDFYKDGNGLYSSVVDGAWTWDMLRKISSEVYNDVNSDGKIDRGDRLGFCVNDYNNLDSLFYGTGARTTKRDDDDRPVLVINNPRVTNIIEKMYTLLFDTVGVLETGGAYADDVKNREKFVEGTSMFLPGFFYTAEAMRDMKSDYGIVPVPMFNEEQDDYVSDVHDIMRIMVLPANCQRVDSVCAVLEELAFTGYSDVLPAYYDVLMKNKYARDDISAEMIDIIRNNCKPDIAHLYSGEPFNKMGYCYRYIMQEKSSNFASDYAAREPAALINMAKFIDAFMSIG